MRAADWIKAKIKAGSLTYDDIVLITETAQRSLGVTVDGKPGRETLRASQVTLDAARRVPGALSALNAFMRPDSLNGMSIPKNRHGVEKWAGQLAWTRPNPDQRHVRISNPVPTTVFETHNGLAVRLHADIGEEFIAIFEDACRASGYNPEVLQGYNTRTIGLSNRLSMHSYGIAVDIDPPQNWVGNVIRGTPKPALLLQYPRFVEVFEEAGWTWGGRWKMKDGMHFQRAGI